MVGCNYPGRATTRRKEETKKTTGRNDSSELAARQKRERERERKREHGESTAAGFEPRIWT